MLTDETMKPGKRVSLPDGGPWVTTDFLERSGRGTRRTLAIKDERNQPIV